MSIEFRVETSPSQALCRQVAALSPASPFYTYGYLQSKRVIGLEPSMLLLVEDGQVLSGCPSYLHTGFWASFLEVESLPVIPESEIFWQGLLGFCKRSRISGLTVNGSDPANGAIPRLGSEIWRKNGTQYVVDLRSNLWKQMRNSHRGRVNRSRKAGVRLEKADSGAWQEHTRAVKASAERQHAKGHAFVETKMNQFFEALVQNGCGELFQALLGENVLSSALVLKARRGALYFWAGTNPDGMALGASHFLVHEITRRMQEESLDFFNLGGADPSSKGLIEFKRGFGAADVTVEGAEFCLGNPVRRTLQRVVDVAARNPRRFLKRAAGCLARLMLLKKVPGP